MVRSIVTFLSGTSRKVALGTVSMDDPLTFNLRRPRLLPQRQPDFRRNTSVSKSAIVTIVSITRYGQILPKFHSLSQYGCIALLVSLIPSLVAHVEKDRHALYPSLHSIISILQAGSGAGLCHFGGLHSPGLHHCNGSQKTEGMPIVWMSISSTRCVLR